MTISSGNKKPRGDRKHGRPQVSGEARGDDKPLEVVEEALITPADTVAVVTAQPLPTNNAVEHVVDEVEAPKTTHLMDINIAGTGVAFYLEGALLKNLDEAREAYASGSVKLVRRPTKAKTSLHLTGTSRAIAGTNSNRSAKAKFLSTVRSLSVLGSEIKVSAGLIAIIGGGGAGKTPLALSLADQLDAVHLTAMEPYPWSLTDMSNVIGAIGLSLVAGMNVVVDSLKDVLFIGSSLGTGGVAMDTFADVTALASIAGQMGCVCACVFNPLYEQDAKIRSIETMMSSSANAVLTHYQGDGTAGKDEVTSKGWYAIFRDFAASARLRTYVGVHDEVSSKEKSTTRPLAAVVTTSASVATNDLVAEADRVQILNRYEKSK